jgi:hypothetical protein
VLVIRAWIEGDPPGLRLRITLASDISTGEEETATAASIEQAVELVRCWLENFVAGDGVVTGP